MPEQGIVKWYSLAKGYGFLRREGSKEDEDDIFVHYSEAPTDPLAEGEHVTFEVVDSPKGLKARNVRRITEDGAPDNSAADDSLPPSK